MNKCKKYPSSTLNKINNKYNNNNDNINTPSWLETSPKKHHRLLNMFGTLTNKKLTSSRNLTVNLMDNNNNNNNNNNSYMSSILAQIGV